MLAGFPKPARCEERSLFVPDLDATIAAIGPLDTHAISRAAQRQHELTKPRGSLGVLEDLAVQLAGMTGSDRPRVDRRAVIVMAGDHGVTAEGVSAYPAEVTPQMVLNFLHGGAAINALAAQAGARVIVVDVGVAADLDHPALVSRKVARGTANMAAGPAMSREQALAAIQVGIDVLADQAAAGLDLVATGEMGIGNTTAASAITAVMTLAPVDQVTGHGTGLDEEGRKRKIDVIQRAIAVNEPGGDDPLDVLAKVGGLEIAGLAGVILGAAARRIPVVLDGFISGAAALIAVGLCPQARQYLIAGHVSVERGHRTILEALDLDPILDLRLRLGEGTGAVLAMQVIAAAAAAHREMATFAEAAVTDRPKEQP
jgi:nicotinate-nucleotide--dimethylbenzimidazole phosphoribosyltransferase